MASTAHLQRALGHHFTDPQLLNTALTHRSAGSRNNERLEFLGDAVLDLVVARLLFETHPDWVEGHLTRARAAKPYHAFRGDLTDAGKLSAAGDR